MDTLKIAVTLLTAISMVFVGVILLSFAPISPFSEQAIAYLVLAGFGLCLGGGLLCTVGMDYILGL